MATHGNITKCGYIYRMKRVNEPNPPCCCSAAAEIRKSCRVRRPPVCVCHLCAPSGSYSRVAVGDYYAIILISCGFLILYSIGGPCQNLVANGARDQWCIEINKTQTHKYIYTYTSASCSGAGNEAVDAPCVCDSFMYTQCVMWKRRRRRNELTSRDRFMQILAPTTCPLPCIVTTRERRLFTSSVSLHCSYSFLYMFFFLRV